MSSTVSHRDRADRAINKIEDAPCEDAMVWSLTVRATLFSGAGAASRALLVLLALTAVSGCFSGRAYEGAARPESSVSVIYGHNRMFQSKMIIRQVDDQEPFDPMVTKAEILPGKHTILILYHSELGCIWGRCDIVGPVPVTATLETEANHKYQIESDGGEHPWVWIVDTTTGKNVWKEAVIPPPRPEPVPWPGPTT